MTERVALVTPRPSLSGPLLGIPLVVAWSVLLAGCGTATLGLRRAEPKAPLVAADVITEEQVFTGVKGVELFGRHYRPKSAPRAILIVHHGLKDHGDRYAPFAEKLVHAGFGASTMDMRGHGRSGGQRVAVDRIDDYLDDLDAFVKLVKARDPGVPVFVFGHSLGGLIVALYAAERAPSIEGVVLSGPGLAFDAPPIQAAMIRTVDALAGSAPIFAPEHADFSTSAAVVADMGTDPLIHQGGGPLHTAGQAIEGTHRLWAKVNAFDKPLLVVHGTIDKLTAPAGSRDFVAKVSSKDKTLRLYEGLNHDLMHEPEGARVMDDIVAWLLGETGGAKPDRPAPPTTALKGDRGPSALSIVFAGGAEVPRDREQVGGARVGATGMLSIRASVGRLGYAGGLDLGFTTLGATRFSADAHLLGLGARLGLGGQLALTGGFGVGGPRGTKATRVPLELTLELPLGPLRVLLRQGLALRTTGPAVDDRALGPFADAWSLLGVRFGRDVRYWGDVTAGTGPYLGLTYRRTGNVDVFGLGFGIDLFGGG
ncbi:MAG: lysophospholipase [Myxococcales bacterium]|nr:lysophospholipase [Myxococcales bacterium]